MPGTGKTALARHLADELGRELIVKQISELLNCYVGNTEKNIAACFDEAERDGAVLLLDEADSLLFPRQEAFRSWEITQVNQFLTMLDNCRTWCICTTNHRLRMDGAAMRRFSFKREFVYARPEQAEELYELLLGELAAQPLSHDQRSLLRSLGEITPGDFHAVRMQYHFADAHSVSFETLLKALTEEQRGHLERGHRDIGFSV